MCALEEAMREVVASREHLLQSLVQVAEDVVALAEIAHQRTQRLLADSAVERVEDGLPGDGSGAPFNDCARNQRSAQVNSIDWAIWEALPNSPNTSSRDGIGCA